jgi:hypothetical protein
VRKSDVDAAVRVMAVRQSRYLLFYSKIPQMTTIVCLVVVWYAMMEAKRQRVAGLIRWDAVERAESSPGLIVLRQEQGLMRQ